MTQIIHATREWVTDNGGGGGGDSSGGDATSVDPQQYYYFNSTPSGKRYRMSVDDSGNPIFELLLPNPPTNVVGHQ